jgi:DNA primase catalytic subunit
MENTLLSKISPIVENENRGYHFHITDQQIRAHKRRSLSEIFAWLETTNRFVNQIQNDNEKMRAKISKTILNN